MQAVTEPLRDGPALTRDLVKGEPAAQQWFGGDFRDSGSRRNRAEWLDKTEDQRASRQELASVLRAYNSKHNARPEVMAAISRLEQPGTLAVAGGQQSGLFTGPLLVIYKAATLIMAAREAAAELGRAVVPVFWIAGEDHDWDEVNHTYVLGRSNEIAKIKIEAAGAGRAPVSQVPVRAEHWEAAIGQLDELLQPSDFKEELMQTVRASFESAETMTDSFAKLMGALFGRHGLILLDSADPALRGLEQPFFRQFIQRNDEYEQAYHEAAAGIREAGYTLQAEVAEGGANLFYVHEGSRLLLHKQDGRFLDRKGIVSFTETELLAELEAHPERFSNNVLSRPLMQDYVLPVLATVLGPGEIAYWAITSRAFEVAGLQMPLIAPRMSYTMVEGTLRKHMDKYGLSFADVRERMAEKRTEWLKAQDELQLDRQFEEVKAAFLALYEPLIDKIGTVQPGLVKLGSNNRDKIVDQIDFLAGKTAEAAAKQHEAALRQWERIEHGLYPLGKPQERVYNVLFYLNRYGFEWIDQLLELKPEFSGTHRILHM